MKLRYPPAQETAQSAGSKAASESFAAMAGGAALRVRLSLKHGSATSPMVLSGGYSSISDISPAEISAPGKAALICSSSISDSLFLKFCIVKTTPFVDLRRYCKAMRLCLLPRLCQR